jgi:hypothetical protein
MKRKELRALDRQNAAIDTHERDYDITYEQEKRRLKREKLQRRRLRRAEEYGLEEDTSG